MKAERLFRVLGLVDSELVEEAMPSRAPAARPPLPWRRWAALAACLALVCALGLGWRITKDFSNFDGGASGGAAGGAAPGADGGNGVNGGVTFMSYAGPVFPLTVSEDPAGLTAERTITWDFAPGVSSYGETRQWGAQVTDAYTLSNHTGADVTVTTLYPFAGSFYDLAELRPTVTVDGEAVETRLYAGAYAGGFQSTFGADVPDTMNLESPDSWTEYRALLESGDYLARALEPYPVLDVPVTVYEFTDFEAPHEQYRAATQAVSFSVDEAATRIFTYGFNGGDWDRDFRRYSYFVPDGIRGEPNIKLLVILGEDIGDYTLEGFQNGGCNPGEEIDGVSCTVIRSETTLDAVLDQLCAYYQERYIRSRATDQDNAFDAIPFEMYRGAVAELMAQYGVLSEAPMDRYSDGRLDDMLSEVLPQERVLYLAFPVTAPAGGSVTVTCEGWKEPSFDFACSGSEHADLQGYDLVTRLGSTLEFTRQSAALVHTEGVHITGQNFGFDPENGVLSVELDPGQEHYYLELRPLNGP